MKNLLVSARNFVKNSLSKNRISISQQDYYMFLISKFLLLKELIIKKDSVNDELHFDCNKCGVYLSSIKLIVDYILDHGMFEMNDTKVTITPEKYNKPSLQIYIWIFNKLRDSLAHGAYEIDLKNKCIIIDNDHLNDYRPYALKCTLPIKYLELFTFIAEKPKAKYDDEDIAMYKDEYAYIHKRFNVESPFDSSLIEKYNSYYTDVNTNIKFTDDESMYRKNLLSLANRDIDLFNKDLSNKDLDYIAKIYEEKLEQLLEYILNNPNFSNEDKITYLTKLRKLGLLLYDKPKVKKVSKPDQNYVKRLASVIEEMAMIVGIESTGYELVQFYALYNYMQLTFAFNDLKTQSEEQRKKYAYLKMSKIHPDYVRISGKKSIESDDKSQYDMKVNAIIKYVDEFIQKMEPKVLKYKEIGLSNFRHSIMEQFNTFHENLLNHLSDKNAIIVFSIRNATEHGNINQLRGKVTLYDMSNQNNLNTVNFFCFGTCEDFYEITNAIEEDKVLDFSFEDLLKELKSILPLELYNKLVSLIDDLTKLNAEALVSVIDQIAKR